MVPVPHYPRLLLDETICRTNLYRMAGKCNKKGLALRPHFKTHQSAEIGNWFKELGVDKITVSSVRMASHFASKGWHDIFIAFPANLLEIDKINRLARNIELSISVESEETTRFMKEHLEGSVNVMIKIDTGYHRTGIDPADLVDVLEISAPEED